jgi:hypothetical protein
MLRPLGAACPARRKRSGWLPAIEAATEQGREVIPAHVGKPDAALDLISKGCASGPLGVRKPEVRACLR